MWIFLCENRVWVGQVKVLWNACGVWENRIGVSKCERSEWNVRGGKGVWKGRKIFEGRSQFPFPLDVCLVPELASWSQEPLQCAIEDHHGFVIRSWKRVSVLSSSCVSFCSGHQKLCVPDVELPRVHVQEPEHEAGAPSCQHICFRLDHKSSSRQRATFGRSPVWGITCFGNHLNQLVFVFWSNPIASCRVGLQVGQRCCAFQVTAWRHGWTRPIWTGDEGSGPVSYVLLLGVLVCAGPAEGCP